MSESVDLLVEGFLEPVLLRQMIAHARPDLAIAAVRGNRGKQWVLRESPKYAKAASGGHANLQIMLVDLDRDECAPILRQRAGFAAPQVRVAFRVAERAAESWVLASRTRFAAFAHVVEAKIPVQPDTLPDPKQSLINIVRSSRSRTMQARIVPASGSTAQVGREYNSALTEFVVSAWDVSEAVAHSQSLARCLAAIVTLGHVQPPTEVTPDPASR